MNSQVIDWRNGVQIPKFVVDAMQLAEPDAEQVPSLRAEIMKPGRALHGDLSHHDGYDSFGFVSINLQFTIVTLVRKSWTKLLQHLLQERGRITTGRGKV